MEWQETIISKERIKQRPSFANAPDESVGMANVLSILEEQAEVSFKAGVDEEAKKGIERGRLIYEDGRRDGRKEVMDWVNAHIGLWNWGAAWKHKIKEWVE